MDFWKRFHIGCFQFDLIVPLFLRLTCFLIVGVAFGQQLPVQHYGASDGLPSPEVYDLLEGQDGRIWIASGNGICAFDGRHFEAFQEDESGKWLDVVIRITQDSDGCLWLGTHKNGVYKKCGQEIKYTGINQVTSRGMVWADRQLFFLDDQIYISDQDQDQGAVLPGKQNWIQIGKARDGRVIGLSDEGLWDLSGNDAELIFEATENQTYTGFSFGLDGELLLGGRGKIELLKGREPDHLAKIGDLSPTNLIMDRRGRIWFSDNSHGVFLLEGNKLQNLSNQIGGSSQTVTKFLEDQSGNIWVGTLEKGLFRFHHTYVESFQDQSGYSGGEVLCIKQIQDELWLIGARDSLYIFDGARFKAIELPGWYYFTDITMLNWETVVVAAHLNGSIQEKKIQAFGLNIVPNLAYQVLPLGDGTFITGYYADLLTQIQPSQGQLEQKTFKAWSQKLDQRTTGLFYQKEQIWQGTSRGLRILDLHGNVIKSWVSGDENETSGLLSQPIRDIAFRDSISGFLIAGREVHAFEIDPQNHLETSPLQLNLEQPNHLTLDHLGRIWVSSSSGVFGVLNEKKVVRFGKGNGLISDFATCIEADIEGRQLVVGTQDGISIIDLERWADQKQPTPKISASFLETSSGKILDWKEESLKLSGSDFLKVEVLGASLGESFAMDYVFYLDGKKVTSGSQNSLILSSLEGGEHELEIKARTPNSEWSAPLVIPFEVTIPWYTLTWVWVLFIFIVIITLLLTVIRFQRVRHQKMVERNRIGKQINQLQLKSLQAMMHPHFASNIVTAVRASLRNDQHLQADQAMAGFGRLMRMNLEMVQRESVNLKDELDRLRHYINLERYSRKANWKVNWKVDVPSEKYYLPPMLLQPFVENAILYGLPEKNGVLEIEVSITDALIIQITDNGPGVSPARENSTGRVSNGIKMIRERMGILSQLTGKQHRLQILQGREEGQGFGVRVLLELPIQKELEE